MPGSVPAAFGSVVAVRLLADPAVVGRITRVGLGAMLLCAVVAAVARDVLDRRGRTATRLVTPGGVVAGALVSSAAVTALLRPVLALVLTFSAVKLLGAPTPVAFLASGSTVLISLAARTSRRTGTLSRG